MNLTVPRWPMPNGSIDCSGAAHLIIEDQAPSELGSRQPLHELRVASRWPHARASGLLCRSGLQGVVRPDAVMDWQAGVAFNRCPVCLPYGPVGRLLIYAQIAASSVSVRVA